MEELDAITTVLPDHLSGQESMGHMEEIGALHRCPSHQAIHRAVRPGDQGRHHDLVKQPQRRTLNEQMITEGYAWAYDGGTKQKNFEELREIRRAHGTLVE